METNHITFADFDDFALGQEHKLPISLQRFRAALNSDAQEEAAPVAFYAYDGNDYAIVDTGADFWLLAITVPVDPNGTGDWIRFEQFASFADALQEIMTVSDTDRGNE